MAEKNLAIISHIDSQKSNTDCQIVRKSQTVRKSDIHTQSKSRTQTVRKSHTDTNSQMQAVVYRQPDTDIQTQNLADKCFLETIWTRRKFFAHKNLVEKILPKKNFARKNFYSKLSP